MTNLARILTLLIAGACLAAGIAQAGTWKVGRDPMGCDGPCNFHDATPGGGAGQGVAKHRHESLAAEDRPVVRDPLGVLQAVVYEPAVGILRTTSIDRVEVG